MDWVTVSRDVVDNDELPRVCMVCGEDATTVVNKTFKYKPPWVDFLYLFLILPGAIAEYFFGKEVRVSCPVCRKHKGHFRRLVWAAVLGGLLPIAMPIGAFFIADLFMKTEPIEPFILICGIAALVGGGLWAGLVTYFQVNQVRVKKISIDGREITFFNVSDAFVKALKKKPTTA